MHLEGKETRDAGKAAKDGCSLKGRKRWTLKSRKRRVQLEGTPLSDGGGAGSRSRARGADRQCVCVMEGETGELREGERERERERDCV